MEPEKKIKPGKDRRPNKLTTANWFMTDEITSGLQKYIRRGNLEKALFCAYELVASGFPGKVFNRLFTIVLEDVGFHRLKDYQYLVKCHEEFKKELKEKANGKMTDAWKYPTIYSPIANAISILIQGPKTRMASHASAAVYAPQEELVKRPIPVLDDSELPWFEALVKCINISCFDLLKQDLNHFAACVVEKTDLETPSDIKTEMLAIYLLGRITLVNDQFHGKYSYSEIPLEKSIFNACGTFTLDDIATPAGLAWCILIYVATKRGKPEFAKQFDLLHKNVIREGMGFARLALFSAVLAYFRGTKIQLESNNPIPTEFSWTGDMFKDTNWKDQEHVLAMRKIFTFDNFVLDKHTVVGKGKGRDTFKYLNSLLVHNGLPEDWFSEEEKARSHRRKEDVPDANKTMNFFFEEGAKLDNESDMENPYKALAMLVYLEAEKRLGIKKAKVKNLGPEYFEQYMSEYKRGSKREVPEKQEKKKKKKQKKEPFDQELVELKVMPEWAVEEISDSKNVLRGQRRTGPSKKDVFVLSGMVFKGPYEMGAKLIKFSFRAKVFEFLETKALLPEGYFKIEDKIFIGFKNLATTEKAQWKGNMDVESDKLGGNFVKIADRGSLGLNLLSEVEDMELIKEAVVAMFDAFILGVGDMHFGNVLVANNEIWLIDYEDDSHRDLDSLKLEDFLFKAPPNAKTKANVLKAVVEVKTRLMRSIAKFNIFKTKIEEMATKHGVITDFEKRIEVAKRLLGIDV